MDGHDRGRLVYTTEKGRLCPHCGAPAGGCFCSSSRAGESETARDGATAMVSAGIPERAAAGVPEKAIAGLPEPAAGKRRDRITAKLRIEKTGRAGKTVTVIDGLPNDPAFLRALAQELKRACGTGGTPGEGRVELQGDRRERLRSLLSAKGFVVKG